MLRGDERLWSGMPVEIVVGNPFASANLSCQKPDFTGTTHGSVQKTSRSYSSAENSEWES